MDSIREKTFSFEKLRRQAENLVESQPKSDQTRSIDILDLIKELKMHQAELETQNEELKRVQTELFDLNREFEDLYEFAPCGYLTLDGHGIITRLNLTAVALLGGDRRRLIGLNFDQLIDPAWRNVFFRACKQAGATCEKEDLELKVMEDETAPSRWVRTDIVADCDEQGEVIQWRVVLVDISRRKRAEEEKECLAKQLQHSQKMEALGALSSGIAHDFNNILAAIVGYSELALDDLSENEPVRHNLEAVITAAGRARNLIRQILLFSRMAPDQKKLVSIDKVVEESLGIFGRVLPKMINIELDLQEGDWPVMADLDQMQQTFMNLATNSAEAIRDRGTITISTSNQVFQNHKCEFCGEIMSGRYVRISFRDDGIGMNPEVRAKMFEPFFSTKNASKGVGLGLSTVYGIIHKHDGHMSCKSAPGRGTEFLIFLPVSNNQIYEDDFDEARAPVEPAGGGSVLVVDDEPAVRDIAQRMLTRGGYKVTLADSGEEALEIFRKDINAIDIVMLDLGMPGMGGKACLAAIKRLDPDAKVLVASGYIQYELTDELEMLGAVGMISKPFKKYQILSKIKAALEQ